MTLRDAIETDAVDVFLNTDEFAESITYYPKNFYGDTARSSRTISAVVFREQIRVIDVDGDTVAPVWQVHVANNSTTGISSAEISQGNDELGFPPRDGQAAKRKVIATIVTQDHGMLVLECR